MKRNVLTVFVLLMTLCVAVFFTSNTVAAATDVVKIVSQDRRPPGGCPVWKVLKSGSTRSIVPAGL
jgi:hypothetical protein